MAYYTIGGGSSGNPHLEATEYDGSDFTGSNGAVNRVHASVTDATAVYKSGLLLAPSQFTVDGSGLTILVELWNDEIVVVLA